MARRRRRRSRRRRSSFLPLVFRVAAILLIGGVIYYFTRPPETQQQIADTVAAKIGEKADDFAGAAQSKLANSEDVVRSPVATTARLISNQAITTDATDPQKNNGGGFFNFGKTTTAASPIETSGVNAASRRPVEGPTANQIFDAMMGIYANAKTYLDDGKIHLDYRKLGLPKREVMKFSTAWDRSQGGFRGELFESKIVGDGNLLTCYIFDVDTKNFGRQQLVIPYSSPTDFGATSNQPPLNQMLADDIARSFIGGSQDFPVANPSRGSRTILLPPAMTLLSNDLTSPWFQATAGKRRLEDKKIGSFDCYCIQSGGTSKAQIYIDKSSSLIRRIDFPVTMLDSRLLNSPDVTEVSLYATFPNATVNRSVAPEQFEVKAQPNSTTVRQFVELAHTLPSDYLGKTINQLELLDRNGNPFGVEKLQGKITTIAWIGNELWVPLVDQISQLRRSGLANFAFGIAYPPTLLSPLSTEVPRPVAKLQSKERLGIPLLLDSGAASNQLQLNEFPVLLVFDQNAKVQFVRSMKDTQWPDELRVVLQRLASGEDVAPEMLDDYLQHLSDYDESLKQVSAEALLASNVSPKNSQPTVPIRSHVRDTTVKLTPNKKWSQDSFARPGNILSLPRGTFGPAEYAIFDGFQTLNFIDERGDVLRRLKLDIPMDQGVSLIRIGGAEEPVLAVFERSGSQVHFFDSSLQLVSSFPKLSERHQGILDCLPLKDGSFLLSFSDQHGVYQFDPLTGNASSFAQSIASNTVASPTGASGLADGEIVDVKTGAVLVGNGNGENVALAVAGEALVSTVRTGPNQWEAIGWSPEFQSRWSIDLTSQLFDNAVESISGVLTASGDRFWAFVDAGDSVCLISDRGTWLGDFKAESPIHGVSLSAVGDDVDLVVSTADKVVCWALNYQPK